MIWRLPTLLAFSCLAACHEMPPPPSASSSGAPLRIWSFEEAALGGLPVGWSVAETNGAGTPATWQTAGDGKAPEGKQLLRLVSTQNSGETFNLLLTDDSFPADVDLSVWIRADGGEEDQGGGLVWGALSPNDYWMARWNPLEDNLRVYQVSAGKRRMLMTTGTTARSGSWHQLRVVARGLQTTVQLDDGNLITVTDRNSHGQPEGGRIGLWAKADATTSFDALKLGIPSPPSGSMPGPEPR